MKTLSVIKAHAGSEAILIRHWDFWKRQHGDIWLACPTNQAVVGFSEPQVLFDIDSKLAQTFGSIESMKKLLLWALAKCKDDGYESVLIQEYDSLFLDATTVEFKPDVFQCNWSINTDPNYQGKGYPHPPLHMSLPILQRLCDVLTFLPDDAEHGYWDRAFGWAIDVAGIPFERWPFGVTRNTIEDQDIPHLVKNIHEGCLAIHGLKTIQSFDAVVKAFSEATRI